MVNLFFICLSSMVCCCVCDPPQEASLRWKSLSDESLAHVLAFLCKATTEEMLEILATDELVHRFELIETLVIRELESLHVAEDVENRVRSWHFVSSVTECDNLSYFAVQCVHVACTV